MAKRVNKQLSKPRGATEPDYGDINRADDDGGVAFNAEKFLEHVDSVRALKHKGAVIRGDIGSAVKNAEEDYGIHRGAASLWIKLKGMEDEARGSFLKAFDDMRTALGYANQGELFDGTNSPAEDATFAGRGTN